MLWYLVVFLVGAAIGAVIGAHIHKKTADDALELATRLQRQLDTILDDKYGRAKR